MKTKRILAFLLSMVMILSLAPMSIVWAKSSYVASITSDTDNTMKYATFEEALTAAVTGDTIKVIGNTSYTGTIDKDIDIAVQNGAEFTLFYDEGTDTGETHYNSSKKFKSRFCNADIVVEDGGVINFNQMAIADSSNPRYLVMNGDFELKSGAAAKLGKTIANGGGVLFQGEFKNNGSFNAGGSGTTVNNVELYLKCGAAAGTITNGEPIYNFCITQPSDETISKGKIKITKINGDLTFGGILTAEVDGFGDSSNLPNAVGNYIKWEGRNDENVKGKEYKIVAEDVGGIVKAKFGGYVNAPSTFKYAYLAVKDEIVTYIKNGESDFVAKTDVISSPDKVYLGGTNAKDTNIGTSEQQALATFTTAVNLVKDGGTIVVCGSAAIPLNSYLYINKNITITGQDGNNKYNAILSGGTEESPSIILLSNENVTFRFSNIKMDGVFQFASFYNSNICEFTDITCSDDAAVLAYADSYYSPFRLNVTDTDDFYIMASNSGLDKAFDITVDNSDIMLQKHKNSFANVTLKNNSTLSTDMTLHNLTSDNTNNAIEPRMDSEKLNTLYIEKTVTIAENFPISVIFGSTVSFGKTVFSSTEENTSLTADKFKLSQVGTALKKIDNDIITTAQKYAINYVLDGGALGENSPTEHTYGIDTILVEPTKSGYDFDGWYMDSNFDTKVETLTADGYTEDITLYAKWNERSSGGGSTVLKYTVKFDTNGGSKITSQTVKKNSTAAEPKVPTKDGYVFDGWYTDSKFTTKYDFDTKVTKNITLYAKWVEDEVQEPSDDNKDDNKNDNNGEEQNPTPSEWNNPFDDVEGDKWFYDSVRYATENNLMNGITNTEFEPNTPLTRAMLVTILYRMAGEPAVNKSIPFADVSADSYYANAVIWAEQNGIVSGMNDDEFAPNVNITREQIAVILYRYADMMGYDISVGENTNILSYTDFGEISEYAIEAMQYAVGSGLINGKTDDTLNPQDNATRAEIAAILNRFIEGNK